MQVLDTVDAEAIRALHERGEFFWLDLHMPSGAQLDALGGLLDIPDLAVEDTKEFGQRPKLDDYETRVLIVFYGAHEGELVEVHVHVSGEEVVTVRRDHCGHLVSAKQRLLAKEVRTEQELVYRILDALAESLRALVETCGGEVERLEEIAFQRPTPDQRRRMSQLRSELFRLQQIVTPQREMLARGGDVLERLPGLERDVARHRFRDVHDDLVLTANEVDYLRELLAEAVTVLLNQMAGRLALVATIFLPLTFATGFFGMNFGWLVRHIDSAGTFFVLGVGGMVVPLIVAAVLLVRAGYVGRR
ncbi:MAG TPA: magnesium transporter CorA family protein [Solirubrobacteraceae bacterium]